MPHNGRKKLINVKQLRVVPLLEQNVRVNRKALDLKSSGQTIYVAQKSWLIYGIAVTKIPKETSDRSDICIF